MGRLLVLVDAYPGQRFEKLEGELVRARVVAPEKMPHDAVTMNSRVVFENDATGEREHGLVVRADLPDQGRTAAGARAAMRRRSGGRRRRVQAA
jgi:hypothetical protein